MPRNIENKIEQVNMVKARNVPHHDLVYIPLRPKLCTLFLAFLIRSIHLYRF